MNFRNTGLLLLCVIVAGGLYWWSRTPAAAPAPAFEAPPIVPGTVHGVRVRFASRDFELRREASGWAQLAPVYFPLKPEAGRAWAATLEALRPLRAVEPGVGETPGLAALALAPPVATVTVITADGAVELTLGEQTLAQTGYVRTDDGRVFVVPDALHNLVYGTPPSEQFADTLPLPPLSALDRITFARGTQQRVLYRLDTGWSLREDAMQRVRPDLLAGLNALLDAPRVVRHAPVDADPIRYGLEPPRSRITLEGPDRPTLTLDFGRSAAVEQGAIFARLDRERAVGPIVALPREQAQIAFAPLNEFRDPRLFEVAAEAITELVLAFPETPAIVVRDTGAGLSFAPGSAERDDDPMELLAAVLGLRSTRLVQGPMLEGALSQPDILVRMGWGVTGSATVQLHRTGSGWVARRSGESDLTDVSEATMAALLALLPESP